MIAFCRICWRHFEIADNDNEEDLRAEAVGAHLKLTLSEEKRTPGDWPIKMERFVSASHAPDLIYGEAAKKARVKRDPGPRLFEETDEAAGY